MLASVVCTHIAVLFVECSSYFTTMSILRKQTIVSDMWLKYGNESKDVPKQGFMCEVPVSILIFLNIYKRIITTSHVLHCTSCQFNILSDSLTKYNGSIQRGYKLSKLAYLIQYFCGILYI